MGQPLIYIVACTVTGNVYVGKTVNFPKRKREHLWRADGGSKLLPKFYNALRRYGKDSFLWFTIACPDAETLDRWETLWIEELDAVRDGYNCTLGGEGTRGVIRSQEYLAKKSIAAMGNKHSLGRVCSPETRAKISAANRANVAQRFNAMARANMSAAHLRSPKIK